MLIPNMVFGHKFIKTYMCFSMRTFIAQFRGPQKLDLQSFVMRSDLACGSTIGPITATETGISTTDIGIPTLAMHSIRELACAADVPQLVALLNAFYRRVA